MLKKVLLVVTLLTTFQLASIQLRGQWTINGDHIYNSNTGNIGIGVANPGMKLSVNGHILQTNNKFLIGTRNDGSPHNMLGLDAGNNVVLNRAAAVEGLSSNLVIGIAGSGSFLDIRKAGNLSLMKINESGSAHFFESNGSQDASFKIGFNRVADGHTYIDLIGDGSAYSGYGTRLIRYGKGTLTGYSRLEHRGTQPLQIKASDNAPINFTRNGDQLSMQISGTGNIGIGTSNPQFPLHVEVSDNTNGIILANSTGAKAFMKVNESGAAQIFGRDGNNENKIFLNATGSSFLKGRLGIGTEVPDEMLHVNGTAYAVKFKASVSAGADFVFEENYELPDLQEVENFIKEQHHLPDIQSASQMEADGINIVELQIKLLQKIEELTLYTINQQKQIQRQQEEIEQLRIQKNKCEKGCCK